MKWDDYLGWGLLLGVVVGAVNLAYGVAAGVFSGWLATWAIAGGTAAVWAIIVRNLMSLSTSYFRENPDGKRDCYVFRGWTLGRRWEPGRTAVGWWTWKRGEE